MLMRHLVLAASIFSGHTASAASKSQVADVSSNTAAYIVPVQQASWAGTGAPIIGPDGAYYLTVGDAIGRIAVDGAVTSLYTFSPLNNFDPTTGIGFNSDGAYPNQLLLGSDGNFYGNTTNGGAHGFGTAFRLTPDGAFTTLYSFEANQDSGIFTGRSLVQGKDGNFYGIVGGISYNSDYIPEFFKLTTNGAYTSVCSLPLTSNEFAGKLVVANDGSFYGLMGNRVTDTFIGVFRFTTDCGFTLLYASGANLTSLLVGSDGNLYATDTGSGASPDSGATGEVLKLSPAAASTILHQFFPETYSTYVPPSWSCFKGCQWTAGKWVVHGVSVNADGNAPETLIQARDGNLYGTTNAQGLDGIGTVFRITPSGSFTTLLAFPANVALLNSSSPPVFPLMEDAQGNLLDFLEEPDFGQYGIFKLVRNAPLTTSISFSRPTVYLGQSTTLSWSSTGATSCELLGDVQGMQGTAATSGSTTVRLYSKQLRLPSAFVAGIQCTAADGSVSNASATVTISSSYPN